MSLGCVQPGVGDPYWFEWYVGLDYVISMFEKDGDIESVTFQKAGLEGVDDVVVRRSHGLPMVCVQVKHKKMSTSSSSNLTFGALISEREPSEGGASKKSLLASLAAGWKQVVEEEGKSPEIVLYTNREMGPNMSDGVYKGKAYKRLALNKFWSEVSAQLESATSFSKIVFPDSNLEIQWKEFAESTKLDEADILPFLKNLTFETGAPSLNEKETELVGRVRDEICAGSQELASRVFDALVAELRRWTTAAGNNVVTADIAQKCICKLNRNPLEKPIKVPVPVPVFPSRERVCSSLCEKLKSSSSKVVFLQGRPGSGKTRLVSCLCERMDPHPVRFYAFKPLDVDDFNYSPDAGIVSPKDLWSTLLNQLREVPELAGDMPHIPIVNEICTEDELRGEVLRLAEALSDKRGCRTTIVIDGIDHAARAKEKLTFLKHLPSPDSIPEGVRVVVSGQPANSYPSYPQWLKREHAGVEVMDVPDLDFDDILMLLTERASLSSHENLVLANEIVNMTKGNTLSVVYAVHTVAKEDSCDSAIEKLRSSGLSDNVEEYYESIWQRVNEEVQCHHGGGSNALNLIVCSMHLFDGAVYPRLLCKAFPDDFSGEHVVIRDISTLLPLMRTCADGSSRPVHNDFRLFVSAKALMPGMEGYLDYASNKLADAALGMEGDVVRSCYAIRLLASAGHVEECIDLFDTSYVIDAVAHGVPWQLLREQAKTTYELACESRNLEKVFKVQLALTTLSQINEHFEYWLERRPFLHLEALVGMDYVVPPLCENTADQYATMLDRCLWLSKEAGCAELSNELYNIWLSGLTPAKAAEILSRADGDDGRYRHEDGPSRFMSSWGAFSAARGHSYDELRINHSPLLDTEYLLSCFRDAYVRGTLEWATAEDSVSERIAEIPISADATTNMMRDVLSGALSASRVARCILFSWLARYSFEWELGTLAYALCLSEGEAVPEAKRERPLLAPREGNVYNQDFSLALFAEAFIFGFESVCSGFDSLVLSAQTATDWIDGSHREYLPFVRTLRAAVCLGYSMGHDKPILPGTKEALVLEEWTQAPSCPGALVIETCAVPYMVFVAERGRALCARALEEKSLDSFIFSNHALCTKLQILNHLQRAGSALPGKYLLKEYGPDGSFLLASQEAAQIHGLLKPLLLTYDKELAVHCDEAILFGSARFTDHKDYSLSNLIECFEALSDLGAVTEAQALELLELDNAATLSGYNRMSDALLEAVAHWAISVSPSQLSMIRSWRKEYRYDYSLIECQLRAMLIRAECLNDVLAVFAGLLGHAPCCSTEDMNGIRGYLEICGKRAEELGCKLDFFDAVSEIKNAIKDAPKHNPPLPNAGKASSGGQQDFGPLSDSEVKEAAFRQKIDCWHWEPVAEACAELERRGFDNDEIYSSLAESRGFALSKEGWVHHSAALTQLVDGIASYADDDSFYKFLSYRNEGLDRYGFRSASSDIASAVRVRTKAKSPTLFETIFELECDSKRRWITCNGRCNPPVLEKEVRSLPEPASLPELATDILLDSIVPQDPHRLENAVRGISWGGLHVRGIINRVCVALPTIDPFGRTLLEKVLDRWMRVCPEEDDILNCLYGIFDALTRADEACVLSFATREPGIILKSDVDAPVPTGSGSSKIPSLIKNYFSTVRLYCNDDCADIKDDIESFAEGEAALFIKRYMRNDETILPIGRLDHYCQELLYAEMCRGRWRNVPGFISASMLVDPADAWVISQLPVCKDLSAFGVSEAIAFFESGDMSAGASLVQSLPICELNEGEACLGWKLYIPYGSGMEYEQYGTARISPLGCERPDNVIDREFGCYGLQIYRGGGRASRVSDGSDSLCNALAGCITMTFCDCQVFPSFAMRKLGFEPLPKNPMTWVDEEGNKIAWFEQYIFPVEKGYRPSAYYRQPRLWRWDCDVERIEKAACKRGFRVYWAIESSMHVDQIKEKHDMLELAKQKSPFEKECEKDYTDGIQR